jgi:hypothetical protein
MSYLRYLCLLAYSCVQHILCCVFCFTCLRLVYGGVKHILCFVFVMCGHNFCLVYPMLPVSLDCLFLNNLI